MCQACRPAPVGLFIIQQGFEMEFLQGLLGAVVMLLALAVIIGLVAALFMIIFGIATGIDDQIQS